MEEESCRKWPILLPKHDYRLSMQKTTPNMKQTVAKKTEDLPKTVADLGKLQRLD